MTPSTPVVLSIVLPAYNEEDAIGPALSAITVEIETIGEPFEIVVVDDGSTDATVAMLRTAADQDRRIRTVLLSRNFGKESAMAAGLEAAAGDAVLFMDADLQHPPSLIPEMLRLWRSGHDVVSAVKETRADESLVYRGMATLFNSMMGGAAGGSFRGASDFKLLDRQVVDAIKSCEERGRFFRGLVTWVGFKTAQVPFTVAERVAGRTKWSIASLVRYSLQNLISFSALPLKLVAFLGFGTLVFAFGLGAQTLYRYLTGAALSGFTTVILLQLILGGLLLLSLGVVALYVAEIYKEVKARPIFVVRRPRNAPTKQSGDGIDLTERG